MSKCDKNPLPLKKPEIKKYDPGDTRDDWIVYKDSIPPPLKHPRTCTDTINSSCGGGKSLEKCIQECDESEKCSFGYHLKYGDNTKCLPIYTSDYYPTSNPTYSLKNQDCYNLHPGVTSHTFISKKRWGNKNGILPDEANAVFFDDIILLGHRLKSTDSFLKNGSGGKVSFQEFGGTKLKLLPEYGSGLTTRVEYGDHVSLNAINNDGGFTSNIIIVEHGKAIFKPYKNTFLSEEQKFTIIPVPGNTCKQFNYNSNFLLRSDTGFLQIKIKKNISTLVNNTTMNPINNYPQNKNKNFDISSMIFNFRPTKHVYTCKNGRCKEHKLTDAKKHGRSATVNGNTAYTRSDCFGSCNWTSGNNYHNAGGVQEVQHVKVNECDNNWCVALTIVLVVLIMLSILVLR